ncbi:hypothetical protein EVA_14009 [gut metagenome]|uniref:Uncharacterized protein n=1 Tax=gut metagenome TaxID=749906 RepID=J9G7V9_9ZZZZ
MKEVQITRKSDLNFLSVTQHCSFCCRGQIAVEIHLETIKGLLISRQKNVLVLKTQVLRGLIEFETFIHVADWNVGIPPSEENHGVNKERQEEIHQDTADHNQQTLPSRFGTELIGLHRLFHLFHIHRLINHTGDLHIASQGQPTNMIVRTTETEKFPGFPRVKEQTELFYSYLKQFCKQEVTPLMQQNQNGKTQHELSRLDQKYLHWFKCRL